MTIPEGWKDDAGPFGRLEIIAEQNDGAPMPFGKVAIAMRNGGWLGSSNGFPMSAPALYSPERAARIVEAWNAALDMLAAAPEPPVSAPAVDEGLAPLVGGFCAYCQWSTDAFHESKLRGIIAAVQHAQTCEKHPMRAVERQRDTAEMALRMLISAMRSDKGVSEKLLAMAGKIADESSSGLRSEPAPADDLARAHDKLVERSVGAMTIAEGTEGHEAIPRDCPMLVAVGALREKYDALRVPADGLLLRPEEIHQGEPITNYSGPQFERNMARALAIIRTIADFPSNGSTDHADALGRLESIFKIANGEAWGEARPEGGHIE